MYNILDKLAKVKKSRNGYMARCPSHNDSTASLSIAEIDNKLLLKCFAGCKTEIIVKDIGLEMSDLFISDKDENIKMIAPKMKEDKGEAFSSIEDILSKYKTLEDYYEYNWIGQEPHIIQVRFKPKDGKKALNTYHKEEDGKWYLGKGMGLTPIYNIDVVSKSKSILIVEGEKLVKILAKYGIPATTSLGGALNPHGTDWTALIGKPSIVSWRDYNKAGLEYENSVDKILSNIGVNIRKVNVNNLGLEEDDDLEQYIEKNFGTIEEVRTKIYNCLPKLEKSLPSNSLKKYLNKVYEGQIENTEIPGFPILTDVAQMFIPGSISLIYSGPGIGKSLLTQQFADDWVLRGKTRVKRLLLESSINMYLLRCLSRASNRMDVLKTKFHKENPEESKKIVNDYIEVLDVCGATMTTSDSYGKKVTHWNDDTVLRWIEDNIKDNDILIIDPISRILNDEVWRTTNRITAKVEELLSEYPHACILFIHHPDAENNISGGKGWSRFCHNILEINKLEEEENFEVLTNEGDVITMSLDRYIRIKKCRSGEGMDYKIGIKMSKESLHFIEMGRILRKIK